MVKLKNGLETHDPRLDFIPHKDERSRNFAAVDTVEEKKIRPRSYFVRKWLDQGEEGACVGFAFTHEACSTPVRASDWEDLDYDFAWEVYHDAQHIDPWDGCSLGRACHIKASSSKYDGTSILAGIKTMQKRGYVHEYRWAFGEQDLAIAVANLGPAVIGVNWYEGMFDVDNKGYLHPSGRWMGGHAVAVTAIDPNRDRYRIWNSWGREWGRNGWAYISRADMAQLLKEDGEACIPLIRREERL